MTHGRPGGKGQVLLVEDDDDIRGLLRFYLEREGLQVNEAADGDVALRCIDDGPPPDLVILDLMLPFVDGLQVLRHLRARPEWADTPVVALTSKAAERDIVAALDAGASDYVTKPFRPQELIARVRRYLRVEGG